jgi:hypothetical protein
LKRRNKPKENPRKNAPSSRAAASWLYLSPKTGGATIVAAKFTANSRLDFATAEPWNSNTFSVFVNSSAVAIAGDGKVDLLVSGSGGVSLLLG